MAEVNTGGGGEAKKRTDEKNVITCGFYTHG